MVSCEFFQEKSLANIDLLLYCPIVTFDVKEAESVELIDEDEALVLFECLTLAKSWVTEIINASIQQVSTFQGLDYSYVRELQPEDRDFIVFALFARLENLLEVDTKLGLLTSAYSRLTSNISSKQPTKQYMVPRGLMVRSLRLLAFPLGQGVGSLKGFTTTGLLYLLRDLNCKLSSLSHSSSSKKNQTVLSEELEEYTFERALDEISIAFGNLGKITKNLLSNLKVSGVEVVDSEDVGFL
jgi:hypothetical protein